MNRFLLERQLEREQKKYEKRYKKKHIPKNSVFRPVGKKEEKKIKEMGLEYQRKIRTFG